VGVTDAIARARQIEIEPREVTRICVVAKSNVNAVGTVVDSDFERGQAARRTHQIHAGNIL